MNSLFCRHNRFTADCPICSKGTLLDRSQPAARPRAQRAPAANRSRASAPGAARRVTGPYVIAGPFVRDDGSRYEVRLERVPGGVRLAQWSGGALERSAPVLGASDLRALVAQARERSLLAERDLDRLERALAHEPGSAPAAYGASPGTAGDMREELRLERGEDGMLRVGRWILRPNQGWQLQEAPTMLPVARYAEAIAGAVRAGLLEAEARAPQ